MNFTLCKVSNKLPFPCRTQIVTSMAFDWLADKNLWALHINVSCPCVLFFFFLLFGHSTELPFSRFPLFGVVTKGYLSDYAYCLIKRIRQIAMDRPECQPYKYNSIWNLNVGLRNSEDMCFIRFVDKNKD